MRRRSLSALLLAAALAAPAAAQDAPPTDDPVRVGYLFSDGNIPGTLQAYEALLAEHPELRDRVELTWLSESTYEDVDPDAFAAADVLVFDTMNEQMLERFDSEKDVDILGDVVANGTVLGVGQGLLGEDIYREQGVDFDARAQAYWTHSGASNQLGLLKLALTEAGIGGLDLPEPELSLDFGFYYPDGASGRVFETWEDFDAWRRVEGKRHDGAPQIAIGFYKATYYSGDTALLDALIAEIERQGADAVPVFGYPGDVTFQMLLRDEDGSARVDAGLGMNFNFADIEASGRLGTVDVAVANLISLYGRSEADWLASPTGLSLFEGTFNLAVPELAGTTAPTVVGTKEELRDPLTGLTAVVTSPIPERVETAVARALRYAALRRTPNAEKRIALLYYNYPPGQANIGASYLNVAESLANVLERMETEGYDLGGSAPDADRVLADITAKARNVIGEAPGELAAMVAAGDAVLVPVSEYRPWLNALEPSLRDKILADWGAPGESPMMIIDGPEGRSFVVPVVRYGEILLTPQPARGWGEDLEALYHANDLAPPHQYVAVYEWLKHGYAADAVVHVGTHGTLEWLDGRDAGLGPDDAPDALIGDLPDLYVYNVDVVGEGLVARRRGMATLVDHMTPPFVEGGLTEDLARLSELLNSHTINEAQNPTLAEEYGRQATELALSLGVAADLGLSEGAALTHEQLHELEGYLLDLKAEIIPYGLHAFGRTPTDEERESTVRAIVSVDRSLLGDAQEVLADEMTSRIDASGPRELDNLMRALAGRFVPGGDGGEPIRNPDAYPTGKNFYGIDPQKVPTPAAWAMGRDLADEMVAEHLAEHGAYPEKISFVIWGDETMRHEGVLESQIFRLLGTEPVWDARGNLVDVRVTPREELGRPRIDIVIASASEGLFSNLTQMMDKAVQTVKALEEADNLVRRNYLSTRAALIRLGRSEEDADRLAGVRIFDEPPGRYNLNTSSIVAQSGSWDDESGFANDYIAKMGHGYGNGFWGESMEDVFRLNLAGVEKVVHSSSTTLYGAIDNDDFFMYMGGLAAAVRSIDGTTPDTVVTNTRDPGDPEMTGLDAFIATEMRSRYVNPTWLEGMQKEGYAGAGAMREFVEYLWGWDATVTDVVDDAMWNEVFETYVEDKHDMGMAEFFEENSPFAYQDITARMIETIRKGYWAADEATQDRLIQEYVESVNAHGASCSEASCGNARLMDYILENATDAGVPAPDIESARAIIEQVLGRSVVEASADLEAFAAQNDARTRSETADARLITAALDAGAAPAPASQTVAPNEQVAPGRAADPVALEGYVMAEQDRTPDRVEARGDVRPATPIDFAWPPILLLGLLAAWRFRPTRAAHA